ncbi:MAG: MATE family efflux transporter [Pirellulales bacterium]|nr:MATE family efflux transporter [Pirellulales bacterium]
MTSLNLQNGQETSWWSRPCGGRDVLAIALPLIVSTASWSVMNFIDRMFLLWYSKAAMAAALPAGMLYFTLVCFPMGIAAYVNTFVAQYQGAGRPQRIGAAVWQGVGIGVVCLPFFLGMIPLAPEFFRLTGHKAELAGLETDYFQTVLCCAGAQIMAAAMSAFFTGRGSTKVVMVVDSSASALNAVLDYCWIFGVAGFPQWGIVGAAWATVVAQWFRVAAYLLIMLRPRFIKRYQLLAGLRFDGELMRRLLRYGGPNGLQLFLEISFFSIFLLLIGRLGENAMAATTLAFNINALAFVPMLGLGIALSTLVGQQLGHDHPDLAARATWTSFVIAAVYMGTMAALYVLIPDVIMMGHAAGVSPEEFASLRNLTVVLLRFVAAYCLFDAMNVVFASVLKGAGDTRFILWTSALISPLPVAGVWFGIRYFDLGILWSWSMATFWVCSFGLIFGWRFLQGHWRTMRVIEHDVAMEEVNAN